MPRPGLLAAALILVPTAARADAFDQYTQPVLRQAVEGGAVMPVRELTAEQLVQHAGAVPGTQGAVLVARTAEGRFAKLLVQAGRQKAPGGAVPALLIDRFVTFKDGTEQARHAAGAGPSVFAGFRFSLDLGMVVPEKLGGDFEVVEVTGGRSFVLKPLGQAKLYLVTEPLKVPPRAKPPRPQVGEAFEVRYFNGTYKLHEDGRRSGTLVLQVSDAGEVTGSFTSDKDGEQYEVRGRVGSLRHAISFTVKYPRVEQTFNGLLFTGDGKALAGTARMLERESAFYALRVEE
jgi:hypothetical protein